MKAGHQRLISNCRQVLAVRLAVACTSRANRSIVNGLNSWCPVHLIHGALRRSGFLLHVALQVMFHCDNSVVACMKLDTSCSPLVMKLIPSPCRVSVRHDFHIPEVSKTLLTRSLSLMPSFCRLANAGLVSSDTTMHASLAVTGQTDTVAELVAMARSSTGAYLASDHRYLQFCQQHNFGALAGICTALDHHPAYLIRSLQPSSMYVEHGHYTEVSPRAGPRRPSLWGNYNDMGHSTASPK